jgi:hypothetical protein
MPLLIPNKPKKVRPVRPERDDVMHRTRAAVAYLNAERGNVSDDVRMVGFLVNVHGWDADRAVRFVKENKQENSLASFHL